jgi:enamine deaminase RidA (YjgF/YER057c/UK114 family)
MQPVRLYNPASLATPTGGYSQVAEVTGGKVVYIAGQVALDRGGQLVGKDDFRAQTQQVFENLDTAVKAAGGDFKHVIKLSFYVSQNVDASQLPQLREVRDRFVNTRSPPTSTLVFVSRLVRPEFLVEVEAVAVIAP